MNYETGICANCGKDKAGHAAMFMRGLECIDPYTDSDHGYFTDSGLKRVADNSVKVLEAAQRVIKDSEIVDYHGAHGKKLMVMVPLEKWGEFKAAIADSIPPETKK